VHPLVRIRISSRQAAKIAKRRPLSAWRSASIQPHDWDQCLSRAILILIHPLRSLRLCESQFFCLRTDASSQQTAHALFRPAVESAAFPLGNPILQPFFETRGFVCVPDLVQELIEQTIECPLEIVKRCYAFLEDSVRVHGIAVGKAKR